MRLNTLRQLVYNEFLDRVQWMRKFLDPRRNLNEECGYPEVVHVRDYRQLFDRGDIATRIVSVYPDESWNADPDVYETEDESETAFESEWNELEERLNLYALMHRADILSGVGAFGIILLGYGDGLPLDQPVNGVNEQGAKVGNAKNKLLFVRTFDESLVQINQFQADVNNPRYGFPNSYNVQFVDPTSQPLGAGAAITSQVAKVHWSRIVHLADNRQNSDVFGVPRLQSVLNRVSDVHKVAGGSGEMYWKGAFPGLSLETVPVDGVQVEVDVKATKEQMEAYMNRLQRYIALQGMTAKSLAPQVSDPNPQVMMELRLIATALGVPWRILIGSEQAQLASEQDSIAWNRRVCRRREKYLNPFVIRPLINRLTDTGVLSEPKKLFIDWPDPNTPTEFQRAETAQKVANAMSAYVTSGSDTLMTPFFFFTMVLGYTDEEAQAIVDAAEQNQIDNPPVAPVVVAPGQLPPARGVPPAPVDPLAAYANNGHRH